MEENDIPGEQVTCPLLARGNQAGEESPGAYFSSVTRVLVFSSFVAVCGSLNYGLAAGFSSPAESEIIDDLGLSTAEYSLFGSFLTIGGALGAISSGKMSDCLGRRAQTMAELESPGEQTTRRLLAAEDQDTEEVRRELGGYTSPVTGVLLFSSFIAVCGSLSYGLAVGYSSPVESQIIDDLGLSTQEYSLFGSFLTVGGALGAIACGKMSDYLGRRATFGVTDVLSLAGWLAIVASQGVWTLYLGRVLLGFALGLTAYVVPVYVAEITPKDFRGGFLVGLFFIPESPRWLVKVHKENEFKDALQRLRGSSADVSREAADIQEYTEALGQTSKVSIVELFQRKYAYTLTVGIGMFALSQLVGTNGIIYYASSIFESAGFSSKLGTILMAIVQVPSVAISLLLMDRFGRRPLLLASASGLCVACLLPGISFSLQDHGWLEGFSPYLALIGLLMFSSFYAIGMGGITFLLISEIYPMNIKGLAGSVATLVGWVTSWVVAYAFNFSMDWSSAGILPKLRSTRCFVLVIEISHEMKLSWDCHCQTWEL